MEVSTAIKRGSTLLLFSCNLIGQLCLSDLSYIVRTVRTFIFAFASCDELCRPLGLLSAVINNTPFSLRNSLHHTHPHSLIWPSWVSAAEQGMVFRVLSVKQDLKLHYLDL